MVKTAWTAAPDPPYADEADLLIRSLTTLLYLLPQPPVISDTDLENSQRGSHQKRRGRTSSRGVTLDRAALLFVSGHEHGDAAAVNAIIRPYEGVHVMVVKERPRGLELVPLDDDGKRWTVLDLRFVKPPSPTDLAVELSKDDIACLLRHGQYVIPPDVHAEHLVGLFHRAFSSNSEIQDDNRRRLKRYVLLYCVSKIKERFDAEWTPGGEIRFKDFFIAADGPHATFSFQEYQGLSPPESDQGLPEFPIMPDDEGWILRWLRSYGYNLDTDPNDQTKILWTPEAGMYVYRCICANINTVRICLAQLEKALKTSSDICEDEGMRYKRTIGALDKLADALDMICLAVYRSPTFWKTMHTLQPLIQRHSNKSRIGSVPEKGRAYPTDPDSDPAEDNCAYELDDLADDPDLRCLSSEAQKLRHWLILLSQWTSSISKLGPLLNKFSRSSPYSATVWAKYADPPIRSREQASLFETLDYVETKLSMSARVQVLKNAASKSKVKARALDIIRCARANEDPSEWLSAFEGGIHCEAQLSEGWQYTELPCHSVGTSRRCCFCCDVLLDCHSLRPGRSSTGEVVPWTPPLGLDPLIKEKILQHLIAKLQRFFMEEPSPSQLQPPSRSLHDPLLFGNLACSLKRKRST